MPRAITTKYNCKLIHSSIFINLREFVTTDSMKLFPLISVACYSLLSILLYTSIWIDVADAAAIQEEQTLLEAENREAAKKLAQTVLPTDGPTTSRSSVPLTIEDVVSLNTHGGGIEGVVKPGQPPRVRPFVQDYREVLRGGNILQIDDPMNQDYMRPWLMRPIPAQNAEETEAYLKRAAEDTLNSPSMQATFQTFLDYMSVGAFRTASHMMNKDPTLLRLQELQQRERAEELARRRRVEETLVLTQLD